MSSQITEIRLLNVPLHKDYKHTLYFSNPEEQKQYFISKEISESNEGLFNFSYQRKDNKIRYPEHIDKLSNCNYLMYRNDLNKIYYAFVVDKVYINDGMTELHIETDVMQTYHFSYSVRPSFIEREHVNDDTPGLHTFPENLECGEFEAKYYSQISDLSKLCIVVATTYEMIKRKNEDNEDEFVFSPMSPGRYNGLYSGIGYKTYYIQDVLSLNEYITKLDKAGHGEAISSIFLAPEFIAEPQRIVSDDGLSITVKNSVIHSEIPNIMNYSINKTILSSGYSPRNNKLKTFPFQYLMVSNNNGSSAVYHYEDFKNDEMEFRIYGALTPGCSIRMLPKNYKGVDENNEEGLNLGKYPICNWNSDVYTNWLTQNSVNIGLNVVSGVAQIVGGIAMTVGTYGAGAAIGAGSIASGVGSIANQVAQVNQMSFTPPQTKGNINCGDVTTSTNNNTFTFYGMSAKPEYLAIIDDFFDMFGYKCNRVKLPNKNHRENFWYTKTIDVEIDVTGISQKDEETIKNCYNNGITFWKNPAYIGNFTVSNNII